MSKRRQKELDYFRREHAQYYAYYRVPKLLFTHEYYQNVSAEAKILYGILLDRMQLSLRNNWFDDQGRVYIYCTIQEIMKRLGCGSQKAVSLLKELDTGHGIGLIEKKRQGFGKPNVIYVKNFASILPKDQDIFFSPKNCDNHHTGSVKNNNQELWESPSNNTDNNKTKISETDQSYQTKPSQKGSVNDMVSFIKVLVDYDILVYDFPDDRGLIDGLIEIMADILVLPEEAVVRISGVERPVSVVKSQFMKIRMFHIQYVLSCMMSNTTKINNIKSYLLAALYNAPMTIDHYYQSRVRHDMYGNPDDGTNDRHGVPP